MKRTALLVILALMLSMPTFGQATFGQIKKDRLFKVDPVSGLFKEIRVIVENRFKGEIWWFLSPHGYHHNWIPKSNDRLGRPDHPQKYYGIGLRGGAKKYFSGNSPRGPFLQAQAAYRRMWVNQYNEGLSFLNRDKFNMWGLGATIGWQNLYGAKDNIVYGGLIGLEYFRGFGQNYVQDSIVQNWYEFPFSWKPDFLDGFRLYIGIELGFAFKQKRLHW